MRAEDLVHGGHAGGGLDFRVGGVGAAVANVVRHRVVEEDRVLGTGPRLTAGPRGGRGWSSSEGLAINRVAHC